MPGKPWTYKEVRTAQARIRAGHPLAEVARDLGRSPGAIRRAMTRHSTPEAVIRPGGKEDRQVLLRAYLAGAKTSQECADALGIKVRSWWTWVSDNGHAGRNRRVAAMRHSAETARRCYDLSASGMGPKEIAMVVGAPRGSVYDLVRRHRQTLTEK